MNEKAWIEYLKRFLYEKEPVLKSKNEDCAVINFGKKYLLFATDALVEDVHFKLSYTSFFEIGVKLAVANLSDIAATGGEPKWALLTIGSPAPIEKNWIDHFMNGLVSTLENYEAFLIGGDTVKSKTLFFNLAIVGETKNPVLRRGAIPGDLIFVSRPLGQSSAFLRLIKNKNLKGIPKSVKNAHLLPEPEVILGKELSKRKLPTSMIDISDGLLIDLWRICQENHVGAELDVKKIPVGKEATLKEALTGGEDYALLFTIPSQKLNPLKRLEKKLKRNFFCIGKIIEEKRFFFKENDKIKEAEILGFDHFE